MLRTIGYFCANIKQKFETNYLLRSSWTANDEEKGGVFGEIGALILSIPYK